MSTQNIILQQAILKRIQRASAELQTDETLRLAPLLQRLKRLDDEEKRLEAELGLMRERQAVEIAEVENLISSSALADSQIHAPKAYLGDHAGGNISKLQITLNWSAVGKPLAKETINEQFASKTMAKFLGRLIVVFGAQTEEKIRRCVQLHGGQLYVTETPEIDPAFRNQQSGELYAFLPIPHTKLFVLTNINTRAKQAALEALLQYLQLPAGFATIEVVPR